MWHVPKKILRSAGPGSPYSPPGGGGGAQFSAPEDPPDFIRFFKGLEPKFNKIAIFFEKFFLKNLKNLQIF